MEHTISVVFHRNIELIQSASKSVYYFRRQEYKKALEHILDTIEYITTVVEHVLERGDYFRQEICREICNALTEILEAKKNMDFVLLADLLENHLLLVLFKVQELILEREEQTNYSKERYDSNLRTIYTSMSDGEVCEADLTEFGDLVGEPLNTKELIEEGYRIEMTPCGVMTGVVQNSGRTFYLHSNSMPLYEAFLLAEGWYRQDAKAYIVYGLGMGYHIHELCRLVGKEIPIIVYESDIHMIKLSCAFTSYLWMKEFQKVSIIYDPRLEHFKRAATKEIEKEQQICIHYPSFCNIREHVIRGELAELLPFGLALENC